MIIDHLKWLERSEYKQQTKEKGFLLVGRNSEGCKNILHFWVINLHNIENKLTDPQSFEHYWTSKLHLWFCWDVQIILPWCCLMDDSVVYSLHGSYFYCSIFFFFSFCCQVCWRAAQATLLHADLLRAHGRKDFFAAATNDTLQMWEWDEARACDGSDRLTESQGRGKQGWTVRDGYFCSADGVEWRQEVVFSPWCVHIFPACWSEPNHLRGNLVIPRSSFSFLKRNLPSLAQGRGQGESKVNRHRQLRQNVMKMSQSGRGILCRNSLQSALQELSKQS